MILGLIILTKRLHLIIISTTYLASVSLRQKMRFNRKVCMAQHLTCNSTLNIYLFLRIFKAPFVCSGFILNSANRVEEVSVFVEMTF